MKGIVGTWTLVSYKHESFEGIVFYPMGPYALGRLIYTDNGFFSVTIMKSNRKELVSDNLFEASAEEKLAAADGFVSFSGKYSLGPESNKIVHTIDLSFFPNWIGASQSSTVALSEDTLEITNAALSSVPGTQDIAHTIWKRADISDA